MSAIAAPESSVEMFIVKLRGSKSNDHCIWPAGVAAALQTGKVLHRRLLQHQVRRQTLSLDERPRCSETREYLVRRDVESYALHARKQSRLRLLRGVSHEANLDVSFAKSAESQAMFCQHYSFVSSYRL